MVSVCGPASAALERLFAEAIGRRYGPFVGAPTPTPPNPPATAASVIDPPCTVSSRTSRISASSRRSAKRSMIKTTRRTSRFAQMKNRISAEAAVVETFALWRATPKSSTSTAHSNENVSRLLWMSARYGCTRWCATRAQTRTSAAHVA
eukprot:Amastigsp_a678885_6.p3 type:complete len:149 gc:universal Amastigsp_a678885_6:742-296(-)